MTARIRPAAAHEADALSAIAFAAKASWGYAASVLDTWRDTLSVSTQDLRDKPTRVAELDGQVAGFAQWARDADGAWELTHLWVDPSFMRRGIGRTLLADALQQLAKQGVQRLQIDADPHAERFYLSCGARRTGTLPAPIDGEPDRVRPQLCIDVPIVHSPPSPMNSPDPS